MFEKQLLILESLLGKKRRAVDEKLEIDTLLDSDLQQAQAFYLRRKVFVKKIKNSENSGCQSFHIEICEQPTIVNSIDEEMSDTSAIQAVPQKRHCFESKRKYTSFLESNLTFLKQLKELTIFEHSLYGRIVSASFDTVLLIVLTKQVMANISCNIEFNKFIQKLKKKYGSYADSVPVVICEESAVISQAFEGGQNMHFSNKYALSNTIQDDQQIIQSPRCQSLDDLSIDSDFIMTDEE